MHLIHKFIELEIIVLITVTNIQEKIVNTVKDKYIFQ